MFHFQPVFAGSIFLGLAQSVLIMVSVVYFGALHDISHLNSHELLEVAHFTSPESEVIIHCHPQSVRPLVSLSIKIHERGLMVAT